MKKRVNLFKKVALSAVAFFGILGAAQAETAAEIANCYAKAYPNIVVSQGDSIQVNQQRFPITYANETNFSRLLNSAQLGDQLSQKYPRNFSIPAQNQDPGRLRFDPFFAAIYGNSEATVRQNLVRVKWAPSGSTVLFNKMNGAAKALEQVGNELAQDAEMRRYVSKTAGTFNYRVISGTTRRSAHAFGVAIDFTLPNGLGKYWKWSGCKEGQLCSFPRQLMQDPVLQKIVNVFEKYGFIWGGKWYHYDSVHFEYRPELLICH